jgi:hypothetical protein
VDLGRCAKGWAIGMEPAPFNDYEGPNAQLLGRVVASNADNDECLDLAKDWFERCTRNHGPACSLQAEVPLPTRLIHIPRDEKEPLRLCVTRGQKGRYVALSYCWGDGATFQTNADTMNDRLAGFDVEELPRTLRDAVHVSRRMGFEFLWIDQVCIQQKNLEDWSRESAAMAAVYGNAAFTICADNGASTDTGILRERDVLRSHHFGPFEGQCLQTIEDPWESMCWQPLYARGWAFQERILSSRNLHFMSDQIAWECNTTLYREAFRGRETNPPDHFAKNMFTKYFHQRPERFGDVNDSDERQKELEMFAQIGAWNSITQEMAVRFFTIESDQLPAMSGMATALQVPGMGRYLAGVWEYNPFLSMAWYCRWNQEPQEAYRGPTWSWVGAEGQLMWHTRSYHDRISSEELDEWKAWDAKYGPRLLEDHMILKSSDLKGDVLEGSHLTIKGFCRDIYILEQPHIEYDEWGYICNEEVPNEEGTKVHMDRKDNGWASISSFSEDLADLNEGLTTVEVPKYLCAQIARERKPKDFYPKTLALILSKIEGEEDGYKRVGLLAFDGPLDDDKNWEERTLKLF